MLERREMVGGACVTEEIWPGFKVSVASYVISLFRPEIIRELRLKQYGLNILPRNPSSFTPLLDGRSLLMGPDERMTCREIAKFSRQDAERYPAYNRLLERAGTRPRLSDHDGTPWHLHLTAEDASWAEWLAATTGLGLARLLAEDGTARLGRCAAPGCGRAFAGGPRNHRRRFCSAACGNRPTRSGGRS